MIRDAARVGIGIGRLPLSLAQQDLKAGGLTSWGDVEASDIALWTLYPSRRLLNARVSAFLNHLKEACPQGTPDKLSAHIHL